MQASVAVLKVSLPIKVQYLHYKPYNIVLCGVWVVKSGHYTTYISTAFLAQCIFLYFYDYQAEYKVQPACVSLLPLRISHTLINLEHTHSLSHSLSLRTDCMCTCMCLLREK